MEEQEFIEILGAREHNLKNVSLLIPRNQLVVFTGLSGSGKSSLAFDTIYAEGQRRYLETFSSYARQFLGELKRPDVDKINGLSPVIAIEQKTVSKNPRSTVGTITEIYDFLRLLFAKVSTAYSPATNKPMIRFSETELMDEIISKYSDQKIGILAPLVKGRKGHYKELFVKLIKQGFALVRVDGKLKELTAGMQLDRYKIHDIDLVVDRLEVKLNALTRLRESLQDALKRGEGEVTILDSQSGEIRTYSRNLMCPDSGISLSDPEPNLFSFNSPYGACPDCNGLGIQEKLDRKRVFSDESKSVKQGVITAFGKYHAGAPFDEISEVLKLLGYTVNTPINQMTDDAVNVLLNGNPQGFNGASEYSGLLPILNYFADVESFAEYNRMLASITMHEVCNGCRGNRLKRESGYFRILEFTISDLASMSLVEFFGKQDAIENSFDGRQKEIAREIMKEIRSRTGFLIDVGLEYLNLNRTAGTLSGGEAQRIRLATQIGTDLTNVLYILDEPSIGLHQRDNTRLINSLRRLRDNGNSVIVVEHDREMIEAADMVVDIGPGAGTEGGHIIYAGSGKGISVQSSVTGDYLSGRKDVYAGTKRRKSKDQKVTLTGCTGNNLNGVNLTIPLGVLVCVTGVSGSGKSTLINHTLYPALCKELGLVSKEPMPFKKLSGAEHIDKLIAIDQTPIGRTPRSNPATYTGLFTEIRNLFAQMPESRIRGYKPGRFSFNVKGGRCETCKGGGMRLIEMNFLPDVYVECETCNGKRYNRETLQVRYKGKSINDVLNMRIDAAVNFFEHIPMIARKLQTLADVGLGYISLGQSSTTLSGGEAQRIKLASELNRRDTGKTMYLMDEPTTGLHFEDVRVLMDVINKLVDRGNSVVIIEHNMDVIKCADWVIDVGPEGGQAGGRIIASGTPEQIAKIIDSHTGRYIKEELKRTT